MYKVFLVDDEPFILKGLYTIIDWNEYGLEIAGQATNGLEALEQLEKKPADIVIADITMPKMDGLELIRRLKRINPTTKFIILSGYNEFDFVKTGIELGIENYLLKPVNVQELGATLTSTVQKLEDSAGKMPLTKKDFNILRDNILYRWVTHNIDPLELKERSPFLQIGLEYSDYTVAIINVIREETEDDASSRFNSEEKLGQTYNRCLAMIDGTVAGVCFCDPQGESIFIFGESAGLLNQSNIDVKLAQLQEDLKQTLKVDTFITIGDSQKSFYNVYQSYEHAKKLQEYLLVYSSGKTLRFDDLKTLPADGDASPAIDYETFSKLLLSKSQGEVFAFIDQVFETLLKREGIQPSTIQNCAVEIVLHIYETLSNLEIGCNPATNDYREFFFFIFQFRTLGQLKNYLKNIAASAINRFSSEDQKKSPVIKQVLNYINLHYQDELSLKMLGSMFNVNSTYLGQLFQKETGYLFSDYVNRFKIEKARQMLLNTNLRAIEISKKSGFSDPNYFFKQFKKYVGVSPTELRNFKKSE